MGTEQADLYLIAEQQRQAEDDWDRHRSSEDSGHASYGASATEDPPRTALQRFVKVLKWIGIVMLLSACIAVVTFIVCFLRDFIVGAVVAAGFVLLFRWFIR